MWTVIILLVFSIVAVTLFPIQSALGQGVECPKPLKMASSNPSYNLKGVPADSSIIITWDEKTLKTLTDGLRDLQPALESVNISGGRYGVGTLLTTEWGIGGTVSWKDSQEIITPEAPLETGTQYRVWTYLYMTLRDGQARSCPRIGGEVIFTTAGSPPDDGNPVRKIDLSKIYHGDENGHGDIRGKVTGLNSALGLLTIDDTNMGSVSLIIYKGIPVLGKGQVISFDMIKIGDKVDARFTGGRVVTVELLF